MIVDDLKNIAENVLGMQFAYGGRPHLNLKDGTDSTKYCLWLLPVDNKPQLNDFNKVVANNWDIALFICIKSDLDAGSQDENGADYYNEKWLQNIKPIYDDNILASLSSSFTCLETLTLSNMVHKEVINLFDENMDGLYITFTIKEDLI